MKALGISHSSLDSFRVFSLYQSFSSRARALQTTQLSLQRQQMILVEQSVQLLQNHLSNCLTNVQWSVKIPNQ